MANNDLHPDTGVETFLESCVAIIDAAGVPRKLGALIDPDTTRVSAFPVFEESGVRIMTDDELRSYCLSGGKPKSGRHVFGDDWCKDQKNYNSCAGWASSAALERARVRRHLPRVRLSGSSIYALCNGNRDAGSVPEEVMRAMQNYGCVPEELGPIGKIYARQYSDADWAEGARYKADECYVTRDRQAFLTGLALGFDGVAAVHVARNYFTLDGRGVAYGDQGRGNHAILYDDLDVLGDGTLVMDHMGSWGLGGYGKKGRAYHTWERHLATPKNYFAYYLIRSTKDDPRDTNKPPTDTGG